jgi:hypothetical protein
MIDFALTVDGQRPDGAGGIHLTVSVASGIEDEPFLYSFGPAGSRYFGYFAAGPLLANRLAPYTNTITRLDDGDYDLLVLPVSRGERARRVIGNGAFVMADARLCMTPDPCAAEIKEYVVKRVSVRNGEVTPVEILLGKPGEAPPLQILPAAGGGPAAREGVPWAPVAVLLLVAGFLSAAGLLLRRQRAA